MSKTFKSIIVLIFTTYHFSFVFSNYYSEPKIIYRQRKSGTWPRSFKIDWPRKAFEIRNRKASKIYTGNILNEIESQMPPKPSNIQQWPAAVETQPRKKDKFPEMVQKSRQVNMVRSDEQPPNILEEPTEKIKNSQKEIQQLKEEILKEKQNKKVRQKKEESSQSEEVRNVHYPKSSQRAVVEDNMRTGGQRHSALVLRQHKHNQRCAKKCYTPKCEVECIGRQGSAACSANKCKASTRGADSAAVCKGDKCKGLCYRAECIAACEGEACMVKSGKEYRLVMGSVCADVARRGDASVMAMSSSGGLCIGEICHSVADGRQAKSECDGDHCVAYGKGTATEPKCEGQLCQAWCVGENCVAKCIGYRCEAMCSGQHCKAECKGKNCTKLHHVGKPPQLDKPWVVDGSSSSSESHETAIDSDIEKYLVTQKPSKYKDNAKDDDDGYYGNKNHIKNTINKDNEGPIDNSGNVPFSPVQVPVPLSNTGTGEVTVDYSIALHLSKRIGDYLKKKILGLKDVSLLRYLPSLV